MIKLAFTYLGKVEIEITGSASEIGPQAIAAMLAADEVIHAPPPVRTPAPAAESVELEQSAPANATTH